MLLENMERSTEIKFCIVKCKDTKNSKKENKIVIRNLITVEIRFKTWFSFSVNLFFFFFFIAFPLYYMFRLLLRAHKNDISQLFTAGRSRSLALKSWKWDDYVKSRWSFWIRN